MQWSMLKLWLVKLNDNNNHGWVEYLYHLNGSWFIIGFWHPVKHSEILYNDNKTKQKHDDITDYRYNVWRIVKGNIKYMQSIWCWQKMPNRLERLVTPLTGESQTEATLWLSVTTEVTFPHAGLSTITTYLHKGQWQGHANSATTNIYPTCLSLPPLQPITAKDYARTTLTVPPWCHLSHWPLIRVVVSDAQCGVWWSKLCLMVRAVSDDQSGV